MSFSSSSHDHKADQAIKNDMKKYPNCTYITQSSVECFTNQSDESNNGQNQVVCDTIKRIQRVCPNSAPFDVYTSKDTTNKPLNGGIDDIFEDFGRSIAGFDQRHSRPDIFSSLFERYGDKGDGYRPSARHPPHIYDNGGKKKLDHGQIDRQSIERI